MTNTLPLGFTFAGVAAGIKKTGASDLALIVSDRPCSAAAVFTRNAFPAAPVLYDRALVAENAAGLRAVAINAGCANACTGEAGLADAEAMAGLAEAALGLPARIGCGHVNRRHRPAPADGQDRRGHSAGCRRAVTRRVGRRGARHHDHGHPAQDRVPGDRRRANLRHVQGRGDDPPEHGDHVIGNRHRRGDRARAPGRVAAARQWTSASTASASTATCPRTTRCSCWRTARRSWKLEAGSSKPSASTLTSTSAFASALTSLCTDLAQQIVRDGEGATKFITIRVEGAASAADARTAAKAVANSPLVKTAFYGGDANWGRILAAVGYSGATVDPGKADLWIAAGTGDGDTETRGHGDALQLVRAGQPLSYSEEAASAIFAGPEITVAVKLGLGDGQATVWTCDLSHDYVSINGHYRT